MSNFKNDLWFVAGGKDRGGIVVRLGRELTSSQLPCRLATGSLVKSLEVAEDRLYYELFEGSGPPRGWVSLRAGGRQLLYRRHYNQATEVPVKESMQEVTLHVRDLSGAKFASLTIDQRAKVLELKDELCKRCGVPANRQQLLVGARILNDNDALSTLNGGCELQLVKLTDPNGMLRILFKGAWSLSGKVAMLRVHMDARLPEVLELIAPSFGRKPEQLELEVIGYGSWDEGKRLRQVLPTLPEEDRAIQIYVFAQAHPDRDFLMSELQAGRMTSSEVALIDPDALMPAC